MAQHADRRYWYAYCVNWKWDYSGHKQAVSMPYAVVDDYGTLLRVDHGE